MIEVEYRRIGTDKEGQTTEDIRTRSFKSERAALETLAQWNRTGSEGKYRWTFAPLRVSTET